MVMALWPREAPTAPDEPHGMLLLRALAHSGFQVFTLILCLSGCGPSGGAMGSFTIGDTTGEYCGLPDNKLAVVIWIDQGSLGSATTRAGADPLFRSEFRLKDGRKIAWTCSTRDGNTGSVEIA